MIPLSKFCPDCGRQHPDEAVKCTDCGLRLVKGNAPEPVLLDNRYEIPDVVKSGAMGCVYRGLDTRLGNIVAVKKMIIPHSPENRERFLREAKLLSQLHHGGLPNVSDFFVAQDPETREMSHFLVMTFIDGKDLETVMEEEKKPLPFETVIDYFRQILEILSYLHSQEPPVIYRDMKPSNIMVSKGKIFLVDFGIARLFTGEVRGTVVGTPGYAAPEQYRGFSDAKSDIYSLGVVMHYLLTGRDPSDFEAAPFQFDSIRNFNTEISEDFDRLIMSMLDVLPENRPESADKIIGMMGFPRNSSGYLLSTTGEKPYSSGVNLSETAPADNLSKTAPQPEDEASKLLIPLSVLFLFIMILFPMLMMNKGCSNEYPPKSTPQTSSPSPSVSPLQSVAPSPSSLLLSSPSPLPSPSMSTDYHFDNPEMKASPSPSPSITTSPEISPVSTSP